MYCVKNAYTAHQNASMSKQASTAFFLVKKCIIWKIKTNKCYLHMLHQRYEVKSQCALSNVHELRSGLLTLRYWSLAVNVPEVGLLLPTCPMILFWPLISYWSTTVLWNPGHNLHKTYQHGLSWTETQLDPRFISSTTMRSKILEPVLWTMITILRSTSLIEYSSLEV